MEKVLELVSEIKQSIVHVSPSQKDEIRVMRSMLNDRDYKVDIYTKEGVVGQYCPAETVRSTVASVLSSAAKINQAEAEKLVGSYEFKKADAETFVDLSKEFVNTFVQTGRKLPLGGRERSSVSLSVKEVEAGMQSYPMQVGVDSDGKPIYGHGKAFIPAYQSLKVHAPCPQWVKKTV